MKHALSFLAGAVIVTAAVLIGGGRPAGMFLAGAFVAVITWGALLGVIGLARVGRFFTTLAKALTAEPEVFKPRRVKPVTDTMVERRYDRMSRVQRKKLELDRWNEEQEQAADELDTLSGRETSVRGHNPNVVALPKKPVFTTTQQDVISALVNQGMPMSKAERAVVEVFRLHPGYGFDELFRACVAPAQRVANA